MNFPPNLFQSRKWRSTRPKLVTYQSRKSSSITVVFCRATSQILLTLRYRLLLLGGILRGRMGSRGSEAAYLLAVFKKSIYSHFVLVLFTTAFLLSWKHIFDTRLPLALGSLRNVAASHRLPPGHHEASGGEGV